MKVSDELRDISVFALECGMESISHRIGIVTDHIEAEMVELPRDADGVPIHVGDTVYLKDGREADVRRINISSDHSSIDFQTRCDGSIFVAAEPTRFTHERPDSPERIPQETEDMLLRGRRPCRYRTWPERPRRT